MVFQQSELTYRLNRRANKLADHLRALGVGPDVLVGSSVERSADIVVGMLGVMKAGGAYVPFDPTHPGKRLAYMMADARPLVVLTQRRLQPNLLPHDSHVVLIDADPPPAARLDRAPAPGRTAGPREPCLIRYIHRARPACPKGSRSNTAQRLTCLHRCGANLGLSAEDTMLAITTLTFDIAVLETFLPLVNGARVVIAPSETVGDGVALADLLKRSGANFLQATPTTLRMLLELGWRGDPRMKILCGGEALDSRTGGCTAVPLRIAVEYVWAHRDDRVVSRLNSG